ncbi:response regulator [Leifsonia sp. McL0607]|uniref:response regulator n=1 Tax=Leifsonia sp. McL0607 TaxID=3415672 RepID=UPI003CF526D8
MSRLLLVEDDRPLQRGMQLGLQRHGYEVLVADDGEAGLRLFRDELPDVVILDVQLPGIDGVEVCRRIRSISGVPVIVVTALDDDYDIVAGLEAGADDYVVKPVRPAVLDARIRAVLRRTDPGDEGVRELGALRIALASLSVTLDGTPIELTASELKLLLALSAEPGRVLSRQQLLREVWEHEYLGDSRLVDNCVQRLRAKIEDDPARPRYIQTLRGFGYRFGPT